MLTPQQVADFRKIILDYYHTYGRHTLPWRTTHTTPYHVLVSEIMLQQTQVDRVVPKFLEFCRTFPDLPTLARAEQKAVIAHWSGLGYNRRGLYLHRAAQIIEATHGGTVPQNSRVLQELPGIGPYTAASIPVFAYNLPHIVIDTNIRSIYIHHFFPYKEQVTDQDLLPYIQVTLDKQKPRLWYSALMDYGVYLKSTVGNMSRKSKRYVKQAPLKGSRREIRGAILKILQSSPTTVQSMRNNIKTSYPHSQQDIDTVITDLNTESFITIENETISLR